MRGGREGEEEGERREGGREGLLWPDYCSLILKTKRVLSAVGHI